jgi:hypothetical protein
MDGGRSSLPKDLAPIYFFAVAQDKDTNMPVHLSDKDLNAIDVIIRRRGDHVIAAIPQFGLFAEAKTIQEALDALEIKKKHLQADLATFANLKSYPERDTNESSNVRWREIYQFTIKSVIALALVIVAISFASYQIQKSLNSTLYAAQENFDRFTLESGSAFWSKVERELDRAANANMPEDTKLRLLTDIRKLVDKWRPFVAEASEIFATTSSHQSPQPAAEKK